MRIILGKMDADLKNDFKRCCKGDPRDFGYLLYELAGLADLNSMDKYLEEIANRSDKFLNMPGAEKKDLPIDASELREKIKKAGNILADSSNKHYYNKIITKRKRENGSPQI